MEAECIFPIPSNSKEKIKKCLYALLLFQFYFLNYFRFLQILLTFLIISKLQYVYTLVLISFIYLRLYE